MFKISIIHPSRNRPNQANSTINKWLGSAFDKSSIEYILSVDKDDRDLRRYKSIGIENGIYVSINRNKSAIEAINNAAKVSTANLIVVVSDDFESFPKWDSELLRLLANHEDFIVKTQDGIQPWIITFPILDRKYYNRFGYIYNPIYRHLFCDTEMTDVGHILKKVISLDLTFKHNHYSIGKSKKDALNAKNDKTWAHGKKLYYARKEINFGL